MEEVDIVIVGAEGVAESGGVINKVSQYCDILSHKHSPCIGTVSDGTVWYTVRVMIINPISTYICACENFCDF